MRGLRRSALALLVLAAGCASPATTSGSAPLTEPPIRWMSLDDYFARNPTTGLLIVRGDTILVERS